MCDNIMGHEQSKDEKEQSEKGAKAEDDNGESANPSVEEKTPTSVGIGMSVPKQPPPPPYTTAGGTVVEGSSQQPSQEHKGQQQDQQGQVRGPPPPYPGGQTGANDTIQSQQQTQAKPVST